MSTARAPKPIAFSPVPLYTQVRETLRERILDGTHPPHAQLPSESEMVALFKVSRITVRQALSDLQRENLIFKIPGKGTFVAKPKAFQHLGQLEGFAEAMVRMGYEIRNQVTSHKTVPSSPRVAQHLGLPDEELLDVIWSLRDEGETGVPRIDIAARDSSWNALVDLGVAALPAYPLPEEVAVVAAAEPEAQNHQTAEVFQQQAAVVAAAKRTIVWVAPSRDEDSTKPLVQEETPALFVVSSTGDVHDVSLSGLTIQGGRDRGLILHKLLKEVLTGEASEKVETLTTRAAELAQMIGTAISDDAAKGLSPLEVATSARRAPSLDAIAAIRPTLVPEFNVYASGVANGNEQVSTGIVDAIAFDENGSAAVIVDWKSDVEPNAQAIEHYKRQVRSYLDMTGTPKGLVVFATSGTIYEVAPTPA